MSNNQQIVIQTLVEEKKNLIAPELSINEFFTIYSIEQILKDYELSYDELIDGIVDGGGDGGIDAIYTFVNGELIQNDTDLVNLKKNVHLELIIIQTKYENGFKESVIEKCNSSAIDLFDLTTDLDSLRSVYNLQLIKKVNVFREQYRHLIPKFPELNIQYYYISKGIEVHDNVNRKVENLRSSIKRQFSDAEFGFEFVTSDKLLKYARKEQTKSKDVILTDNPISTQDEGYIALVNLNNYYDFITDESGRLLKYFFDANVRDYQGGVEVNNAIKDTLLNPEDEDFWWLNNGVTITATNASYSGKKLTIEDPQIVNGLQSSFEIFKYLNNNQKVEKRSILIRVITPTSEASRLNVIKATNSQTKVPSASLRATDEIHRDIEDYLMSKGYYYDRRKNFHKNQGRPYDKIISIPYLAQIVMAIVLQEPDYSRARPSTLINKDSDYKKIFNPKYPIEIFLNCIKIQKKVENFLKSSEFGFSRSQIGDLKYHVGMYIAAVHIGSRTPTITQFKDMNLDLITDAEITSAIENIDVLYDSLGGTNAVAKGKDLVNEVKILIEERLAGDSC